MRLCGCLFLIAVATGCGFHSPAAQPDSVLPIPDGGLPGMWSFDSVAEFGAAGHVAQNMAIEARGSLTPTAYTYGGLVAHGLQGMSLWKNNDTSWTKLDGMVPSGTGLWCGESLPDASDLQYFGITAKTSMTIWFEGEVWL